MQLYWLLWVFFCWSLTLVRGQVNPSGYRPHRNPRFGFQPKLSLEPEVRVHESAGQRAALDPRFPVPRASYKLTSEGPCGDVDKFCWEKVAQVSIFVRRAPTDKVDALFSRKPEFTCEECLKYCLHMRFNESLPSCEATVYDHRSQVCDLFSVSGQEPTHSYHIGRHPGRDYFRPTGNPGCEETGDTRINREDDGFEGIIEGSVLVAVDRDQIRKKPVALEAAAKIQDPADFPENLGGPLPADLPELPSGVGSGLLEPPFLGPGSSFPDPNLTGPGEAAAPGPQPGEDLNFGPSFPGFQPGPPGSEVPVGSEVGGPPDFGFDEIGEAPAPLPQEPQPPEAPAVPPAPQAPPAPPAPPAPQQPRQLQPQPTGEAQKPEIPQSVVPQGIQSGYDQPAVALKLPLGSQCNYDANCWEQKISCTIRNGFLFRRVTGASCEECIKICQEHENKTDSRHSCKAVKYDHNFRTCDLFTNHEVIIGSPNDIEFPVVAGQRFRNSNANQQCYRRIPGTVCGHQDECPNGPEGEKQIPRFLKYKNWELDGESYLVIDSEDSSPESCMKACNNLESLKTCRSFDYNPEFGCELNIQNQENAEFIQAPGSSYFEKSCLPESAENTQDFWPVYPQKLLLGFARAVVDSPTLRECQISCLQSEQTFGFTCRSLMFYFEEGLNCILNSDTRFTRPGNFIDEDIATMVYVDVPLPGFSEQEHEENQAEHLLRFNDDGWTDWSECNNGFQIRHEQCQSKNVLDCPREYLACGDEVEGGEEVQEILTRSPMVFNEHGLTEWSDCVDGLMTRYEKCDNEDMFECPKEHIICETEHSSGAQ